MLIGSQPSAAPRPRMLNAASPSRSIMASAVATIRSAVNGTAGMRRTRSARSGAARAAGRGDGADRTERAMALVILRRKGIVVQIHLRRKPRCGRAAPRRRLMETVDLIGLLVPVTYF